jgi:hypothetical protein
MSSFTCPYLDIENNHCLRLDTECVPGRKGCILRGQVEFAVPAEERVRAREEEKRQMAFSQSPVAAK